eukprot:m.277767 g.277767  ORF g.277767 m.277767 type:complete len:737 (+) comp16152_c0_seq2:1781-3991(+)
MEPICTIGPRAVMWVTVAVTAFTGATGTPVTAAEMSPAQLALAQGLGRLQPVADSTSLSNVGSGFSDLVPDPVTGKLIGCPYTSTSLLVFDPVTNATARVGNLPGRDKWAQCAFVPDTGKIYGAPSLANAVLVFDPHSNVTDTTTLDTPHPSGEKRAGLTYCPTTRKLYLVPDNADALLIIDPRTNVTDNTTLRVAPVGTGAWRSIAFAPNTNKLYGAPFHAAAILVVNPADNTTDTTSLGGFSGSGQWEGIAFAASTGKLYATPRSQTSVLVLDPRTNATDTAALAGLPSGDHKWFGMAYDPTSAFLIGSPLDFGALLIVNPVLNTTTFVPVGVQGVDRFSRLTWASSTRLMYGATFTAQSQALGGGGSILILSAVQTSPPNPDVAVTDLSPSQLAHARNASLLREFADTTTFRAVGFGWLDGAVAENTGKLYAVPYTAQGVLVVDSRHNTTDFRTLDIRPLGAGGIAWSAIAFAPVTNKLYCAPYRADGVLVVDPILNTTATLPGLGLGPDNGKWDGICYCPTTQKLYAAPANAVGVLVIDPVSNVTDNSTIVPRSTGPNKWFGITFAPITGKLYAAPYNEPAVLVIDPQTNATDVAALGGFSIGTNKWHGIVFCPLTNKLLPSSRRNCRAHSGPHSKHNRYHSALWPRQCPRQVDWNCFLAFDRKALRSTSTSWCSANHRPHAEPDGYEHFGRFGNRHHFAQVGRYCFLTSNRNSVGHSQEKRCRCHDCWCDS